MLNKIKAVASCHIFILILFAAAAFFLPNQKKMAAKTLDFFNTSPAAIAQCANQTPPCSGSTLREARRYYESLAVLTEPSPMAGLPLSYIYYQLGLTSRAIKYAQEAQAHSFLFYGTHYNNGIIFWRMRQWKNAAKELELAVTELTSASRPLLAMIIEPEPKKVYFDGQAIESGNPLLLRLSAYTDAVLLLTLAYAELGDYEAMERTAAKGTTLPTSYKEHFLSLQEIASYRKAHHDARYRQADIDREQKTLSPQLYCVIPILTKKR